MISNFYSAFIQELRTQTSYTTKFGFTRELQGSYITVHHIGQSEVPAFFGAGSGETACRYFYITTQVSCHSTPDGNTQPSQTTALAMADTVQRNMYKYLFEIEDYRILDMTIDNLSYIPEDTDDAHTYAITMTYWIGTDDSAEAESSSSSSSSSSSG